MKAEVFLDDWLKKQTGLAQLDAIKLRQWQMHKAQEIADYACRNSSFYRTHLAKVSSFDTLPFTDSQLLANNGEQMLCTSSGNVARVRTFHTTGTTGTPKRIFFSEEDLERTTDFFAHGMEPIATLDKPTLIMLSDDKPGSIASLLQAGLNQTGRAANIYGRPKILSDTIAAIQNADCLVGFPADIFYLCRKAPQLRPTSVLLSADYIPAPIPKAIEAAWKCVVFCHYGLTETCYGLGVECPEHQGMHLRHGDFYVEIIHPQTLEVLPYGEEGEIVLTSLQKSALPLIRYRTGDIGSLTVEKCGCSSELPRLNPVKGRIENLKQPINIHQLDDILFAFPELASYEAHLNKGTLTLSIDSSPLPESLLQQRINYPIQINYVKKAPWEAAGKRKLL